MPKKVTTFLSVPSDTINPENLSTPTTTTIEKEIAMTQTNTTTSTTGTKKEIRTVALPFANAPAELWFSGYDASKALSLVVNPGHSGGDKVGDNRVTLAASYAFKDWAMGVWDVPTRGLHFKTNGQGFDEKLYADVMGIIGPSYDGSDPRFPRIADGEWHLIRLMDGQPRIDWHAAPEGQAQKHVMIDMFYTAYTVGKTIYIELGKNKRERVQPIIEQLLVASKDLAAGRKLRNDHLQARENRGKETRMFKWEQKNPEVAAQRQEEAVNSGTLPTGKIRCTTPTGSVRNFNMDDKAHVAAYIRFAKVNPAFETVATK